MLHRLGTGTKMAPLPRRSQGGVGSGRIFQVEFDVKLMPGGFKTRFKLEYRQLVALQHHNRVLEHQAYNSLTSLKAL